MTIQLGQILENNLISQLEKLGYEKVVIRDEKDEIIMAPYEDYVDEFNQAYTELMRSRSQITCS